MQAKITVGVIFAGPPEEAVYFRRKIEDDINKAGLKFIFAKSATWPRRLLLVEDGPGEARE